MTNDITFDKNIKIEFETRAAKTIQRWYREVMQNRLMKEAEMAIEQTR